MWQLPALLLAVLVAAGVGWRWRKRGPREGADSRDDRHHEIFLLETSPAPAEPAPPPAPEQPAPPAPPPAVAPAPDRAWLDLDLIPRRAGTNLLSAAVEYTIVVRNEGTVTATGVRLDVRLLSAGPGQDAVIAALFAGPIARPDPAPFDLPPNGAAELGGMAQYPKDALEVMEVGGRVLFVPVLTVNLAYGWDEAGEGAVKSGQTARSYVIGIDRGGDARLQPFRLDASARMYDSVGALAYTAQVQR